MPNGVRTPKKLIESYDLSDDTHGMKIEELIEIMKEQVAAKQLTAEPLTVTVSSPHTGRGGNLIIIDDPQQTPDPRHQEMLVWYPRKSPGRGYDADTAVLDPILYHNTKDLLARFFIQSHAQWGAVGNWRHQIIGVTSFRFHQGSPKVATHMPMFDYDGKNVKKVIRKDVKLLQGQYNLGDAWVYETRRGFHVYFFCDAVGMTQYIDGMLNQVQCCQGFKRASRDRGYGILRVSAKYTDFDIRPLYVLSARQHELKRMSQKAHTIRALIDLGTQCGTHFASMFPQWAHFQQDYSDWKPNTKKATAKRIKRMPRRKVNMEKATKEMFHNMYSDKAEQYIVKANSNATATATTPTYYGRCPI